MSNISFNEKAWGASGEFLEASSFWNQISSPVGLMAVPVPALSETLHFQVFACACPLPEMPLPVSTPMSAMRTLSILQCPSLLVPFFIMLSLLSNIPDVSGAHCERPHGCDDVFGRPWRFRRVVTRGATNYSFLLDPELHSAKHPHIFKHVDH